MPEEPNKLNEFVSLMARLHPSAMLLDLGTKTSELIIRQLLSTTLKRWSEGLVDIVLELKIRSLALLQIRRGPRGLCRRLWSGMRGVEEHDISSTSYRFDN